MTGDRDTEIRQKDRETSCIPGGQGQETKTKRLQEHGSRLGPTLPIKPRLE